MKNRSEFIGGSDIPNIMGKGYLSPYEMYLLKKDRISIPSSFEVEMGKKLEPIIADIFLSLQKPTDRNNWFFNVNKEEYGLEKKHSVYPFLIAHLDGYNEKDQRVFEAKSTSIPLNFEKIPTHWLCQMAYHCELSNAVGGDIIVMYDVNKLHIYHYEANKELQNYIINKAVEFWNVHIINDIPPLPQRSGDIKMINQELFHLKKEGEKSIMLKEESLSLLQQYKRIQEERKILEKKEKSLQIKLFDEIKEYDNICDDNGEIVATYKFDKVLREFIDNKLLKEKYPKIYEEVKKIGNPVRRFLFKKERKS